MDNSGDRSRQTSLLQQCQRSIRRFQLSEEGNEQLIVLRFLFLPSAQKKAVRRAHEV